MSYADALLELQPDLVVLHSADHNRSQIFDVLTRATKRSVIITPLQIKQFAMQGRWFEDAVGTRPTAYAKNLLQKHNRDYVAAGVDWIASGGIGDGDLRGQAPQDVAEQYLIGLLRAHRFAKSHTHRPVQILGVGHQMDLDTVVTYLANAGTCDHAGFQKVAPNNQTIDEAEYIEFEIHDDGTTETKYRERTFQSQIDLQKLQKQAERKA